MQNCHQRSYWGQALGLTSLSSVFSSVKWECEGACLPCPVGLRCGKECERALEPIIPLQMPGVLKASKYHRLHCTPDNNNSAADDDSTNGKFSRVQGYRPVSPSTTSQGKHM